MCCQTANNRLDAGNSELASHIFGGNITSVVINHQITTPRLKEVSCMGATATGLVVEHHDPRCALQIVAAIGPHIGPLGHAFTRIKLLYRGFISMQHLALQEQFRQSIHQRLQAHAQLADPLRQRRTGNRYAMAVADLLDPIQGQMIQDTESRTVSQDLLATRRPCSLTIVATSPSALVVVDCRTAPCDGVVSASQYALASRPTRRVRKALAAPLAMLLTSTVEIP